MTHAGEHYTQATTALSLGGFRATLDVVEKLEDRISLGQQGGLTRQKVIHEIILAGLTNLSNGKASQELSAGIADLLRILIAAQEVDVKPHPCPRNVDPRWHESQENDRLAELYRQVGQSLNEAYRLARRIEKAAKELK
jgi:hypothetical protein